MELGPRPGYWEANGIVCEGFVCLELLRKAIHLTLSVSGPMAAETCRLLFSKTFCDHCRRVGALGNLDAKTRTRNEKGCSF